MTHSKMEERMGALEDRGKERQPQSPEAETVSLLG